VAAQNHQLGVEDVQQPGERGGQPVDGLREDGIGDIVAFGGRPKDRAAGGQLRLLAEEARERRITGVYSISGIRAFREAARN
jgi:hypothetical protein